VSYEYIYTIQILGYLLTLIHCFAYSLIEKPQSLLDLTAFWEGKANKYLPDLANLQLDMPWSKRGFIFVGLDNFQLVCGGCRAELEFSGSAA